ncbi:MAG: hypothetical protein ACR2HR_06105 [Euzebya sp.]
MTAAGSVTTRSATTPPVVQSGFAATAAWIGWVVIRRQHMGMHGRQAIPPGYGLAGGLLAVVMEPPRRLPAPVQDVSAGHSGVTD